MHADASALRRFILCVGSQSEGGCTFDEDSDASLCDYRQGQEDDFDWQLIRTYSLPHATPDLLQGTRSCLTGMAGFHSRCIISVSPFMPAAGTFSPPLAFSEACQDGG
ncbi:hypothetical protein NHX12_023838 [Muraenolepis orangiensis]|uniref:MAM domain-containing protein n=1 Tax=Muraenolepis orangiensis TaxID=630683 RepID=A0A9Q0EL35_9TELE|nr:hypothetical protein NHX12_023838 [Muraenolepis orangiensis]